MRRGNLSRLIQLVHRNGPQSRAQLTRATGLNRSTIAALAGELAAAGLLEERAPDPTNQVGRPSPILAGRADVLAVAVNPEVDAVTIGAVGLNARIAVHERIEMDGLITPEETAELVADTVGRWREMAAFASARLVGVGYAIPGLVRNVDGLVRAAPHLRWVDAPIGALTEATTGLRVSVGNDANLGAAAEHLFGAGRGLDDLVYLNGGASGIGGGLIVRGRLAGGVGGFAGEFGRVRPGFVDEGDQRTPDGMLEDEVNRARLLEVVHLPAADEPTLAAALGAAISAGDAAVAAEVARQCRILGSALANATNVLNPSAVILGGFLATLAGQEPDALRAAMSMHAMPQLAELVELRTAALGEDRLLIGAAEAAFAGLLADPLSSPA